MIRKANILLADGDGEFARQASTLLARAGHRLVATDRGVIALERLRAQPFDLALVNLSLPDGEGPPVHLEKSVLVAALRSRFCSLPGGIGRAGVSITPIPTPPFAIRI